MSAFLLFSCANKSKNSGVGSDSETNQQQSFSYTFTDFTGAEITLDKKPENVAVLFSSFADIWQTAGGEVDITVGESVERGFADDGVILVDLGAGHSSLDMETLINSEPDLVIGTADYECQRDAVEFCRGAGIPSAVFKVEGFDDYLNVLEIFCQITGETDRYQSFGTMVKSEITDIIKKAESKENGAKIIFIRAGSSAKSTKAKNSEDNFAAIMLKEMGCINIADSAEELADTLSLEAILDENPDYLFITTMGNEDAAKDYMNSLLQTEGWRELDCVKEKQYYFLPKDLFHFKPNSRWAEAYEYIYNILYQNPQS